MRYGLDEEVILKLKTVFSKHPEVKKVILYGSRAKGNFKNGSDIDLTLLGDQESCALTIQMLYKIEDEIDDLYLPYKADLSLFKLIDKQELIDHIRRVGVPFYISESH
jgi:uncharacterized protein